MALELGQRIGGVELFGAIAVDDRDAIAAGFDLQERIGGEKAVAADLLAADDAFEQAGARTRVELVKRRDRRERIADQAAVDRHEVRHRGRGGRRCRSRGSVRINGC